MKALRVCAVIALLLFLLALLGTAYLYKTAKVVLVSVQAGGVSAASEAERFEEIRMSIDEETYTGTLFNEPLAWNGAEDYIFLTYTIRLRNDALVPIEMTEVRFTPRSEDILQLFNDEQITIGPGEEKEITAVILSEKNTHPIREIDISYYVWGKCFHIRKTTGE